MKALFVIGLNGLIGNEMISFFSEAGCQVYGIYNDIRTDFFEPKGDTQWNQTQLKSKYCDFIQVELGNRDKDKELLFFKSLKNDAIIQYDAQPSNRHAASMLFYGNPEDALNLLHANRLDNPKTPSGK